MSNWEVKKVLDISLTYDICCDLCEEVTYNYLKQCPICKLKNIELEEYGSLQQDEKHICTCSNCKSRFKLVSDEWYYPNFPESIGDETKVILVSNKTKENNIEE